MNDTIVVLDFGSQYNQLIVRRIRQCGVYCELLPATTAVEYLTQAHIKGIILSGSFKSVVDNAENTLSPEFWNAISVPVLGICYGMQYMVHAFGGEIQRGIVQEYGTAMLHIDDEKNPLFRDVPHNATVWMSHADTARTIPQGWRVLAHSDDCPHAAVVSANGLFYGIQFHAEVTHTEYGMQILKNFAHDISATQSTWSMRTYMQEKIADIKECVGNKNVICALSGGVDSTVTAMLLEKAIGSQLHCIFVDHGFLREREREEVQSLFSQTFQGTLHIVDATDTFFQKLAGVTEPEQKRKIIGATFIEVFADAAKTKTHAQFLAQGTLYTDIVESGQGGASQTIKSHHNVGGLPDSMNFTLIEPLKYLYKDEVRVLGLELGLAKHIVFRQPFPGPGLAIRVLGSVTPQRVCIVRKSDALLREEIALAGLEEKIWQYFTVLTGINTVGIKGDVRVYGETIAIRAIDSHDGMSASVSNIPFAILQKISSRITNEIFEVNRVVFDITTKPPSTIEWE